MNKAVASILNKVLGDYVEDLNSKQLNLSILKGELELGKVKLRREIFNDIGYPFNLKYGYIENLYIRIPWTSLASSPIQININGVYALIAPLDSSEWNEDIERINQDKNKFKQLDSFESSIATQNAVNKIPNFVQRLVGKIVDNIQINISSIYIRYEDSITSNESYSMGFILKGLSAHTINKAGKVEFASYKDSSHKLILLDDACFFVDYGSQNIITDRPEDFELIAKLEMEIPQKHRFLLRPVSFRITLDINKNNKQLDIPQINANLICGGIGTALEAKQLLHFLKLMEFLRVFANWQKGIEIHRQEFEFTYSEELMYRVAYKKWRIHQKDELRRNIEEMEKGHSLKTILNSRKAANREFEEQWAEKAAKEKVSEKGTLSSIKGFFTGEKEEDNLDEENKLVDKMLSEKSQLSSEIETFVMDSDIFHDMPDNYIRFKFSVHVNIILFSLRDEESELTLYTMMHPNIEIGIRPLTKFVKAKVESLSLEDRYLNSQYFPNILTGESLLLEFDQFPSIRLKIDIKLLQFCMNFETLLKIADEFKTKAGNDIDFSPYMKSIEAKTQEFAEQGEKYVQDLLKSKVPTPIFLDIFIKAPTFFIPMNPKNIDEGMIVVDMGYLKGATSEERISNYDFDKYLIALENIEIFMVWNADNIENWRKGKTKAILPSVDFNIFIYVCHEYQRNVPGYMLAIHAGLVSFILEQAVFKWVLRLLSKIKEKSPPGPDINKIEEEKEKEEQKEIGKPVEQTEAIKDKMKRIEDSVSLQVSIEFEEISLKLIKDDIDLMNSVISRTKLEFIFGSQGEIFFDFQLKLVEIKDLRPNVKLRYAIINPLLFDRSIELDSNITFFAIKSKFKPKDDLIELDINISGIRLMPSTNFISEIIQFFTLPIQDNFPKTEEKYNIQEKVKNMEKPPVSKYTTKSIIKVSINLHKFELLMPLDLYDINKRIGCFKFGISIVYHSCQEYTSTFDKFKTELSKDVLHASDEGSIEITGIGIFIGLMKNNLVHHASENTKDIISPSRLSLVYQFIKTDDSEAAMAVHLNIESFCIDIGFRDIFFGKLLADSWLMLDTGIPKEEKTNQAPKIESENQEDWIQKASKIAPTIKFYIESDAFQLTLIDDTTDNAYPLLHFHMSNLSIFVILENLAMNSAFSSFLFIDYYNLQLASWEPLMEEWNFQLTGEQNNSSSVMILKFESSQVLNINFSMALLNVVKILMSNSDTSQWKEEQAAEMCITEEKLAHGHYSYEVYNDLGKNIQMWLDTPSVNEEIWTLQYQEHLSFEQNLVEKIVAQSRPKGAKLGLLDFNTPATISIKMDDDIIYRGILIESAGVSGYKFKQNNVKFIVDIVSNDNKKTIRIQSQVLIVNETKESIKINLDDENNTIERESAFSLPLTWLYSEIKPKICGPDERISIFEEGPLNIGENKWIIVKSDFYKTSTHVKQRIIHIKYPFTFRNLLACPVEVYLNNSSDPLCILAIGEDFSTLKLDPRNSNHSYKFLLKAENEKQLETNWFSLSQNSSKTHSDLRGNYIGNTLSIEKSDFLYTPWETFHLLPRKISKREDEEEAPLKAKLVEIYSKYLLVNKTDFALDLGYSKIVLPAHSNGFMKYGKKLRVRIASTDTTRPSSWSNKFSINATGISGIIELNTWKISQDEPDTIIIGVSIIDGPSPLFKSKIIYFCPRFIISNHLGYNIFIRQRHKRAGQRIQEIINDSSIPYQLESAKLSRLIQISRDKSAWSSPFNLERIDDFQIKIPSINEEINESDIWFEPNHNNCFMNFIRVVISSDDEACISISFLPPKDPEFRIRNYTDKEIIVGQPKFPTYLVPPGGMIPWAFDDMLGNRKIMILYDDLKESYSIDKIEQMKDLGDCKVEVVAVGVTRELRISPANINIVRLDTFFDSKKKGLKLLVNFTGFGLSIIDNDPKEFLYISLKDMFWKLSLSKKLVKNEAKNFTKIYFELGEFQIDNMKTTHKQFPVIFNSAIKTEKSPFLQMKINKINSTKQISEIINVVKSIDNYSWIEVALQEMETHVDLETIMDLADFAGKIQSALASPIKKGTQKDSLKDAIDALDYSTPVFNYEESNLTNKAYFQYLRLRAIRILISFRVSKQKVEVSKDPKMGFGLLKALTSIGSAFINFSNSPFRFGELLIHHNFQSPQEIGKQITKFYTREGISQFYKIIGSVDLLGNPIGLFDTLGKGVTDFFVEPSKKAMKGPKSFSRGLGKGFRSLMGNTISGSFGGVNKITGSLYGIVREMTGDQYGSTRIENEGKVFGSLYKGMKGSVQDISEGIAGVVVKPYRGAKKKGAGGFFKGCGSGIIGAVCSPVSAALRLGTGITGCAANAGTVIAKGRTVVAKRARFPRYFGVKKVLEPYSYDISRAQYLMSSLPDYRKEKIVYYSHLIDFKDQIILLTMNNLLVLIDSELSHALNVDEIQVLEIHSLSNIFVLYCGNEGNMVSLKSREFSPLVKLYSSISSLSNLRSTFKQHQENEVAQ